MIVLEWLFLTIAPCDAAEPWQLGSQDAATPMMQGIIDLHHDIFFFLILILVFVSRILLLMERSRGNPGQIASSSLSVLAGGAGDDPNRRRRQAPVTRDTVSTSITLLRQLVLEILVEARDQALREGLNNPSTQAWNRALESAITERFGHSRYTWHHLHNLLSLALELTVQGEQSPFFLRVIQIIRERH
uniref:Cytochrome oxidase subunit II transmembrane region profile domain-containing protein n=1 Tax=Helianthus grosseserratus TaxID=73291 RepID=A0A7G8JSV9_HELGR|nr:hypothetical protein JAA21_mgp05 [Helianthus grosseserratus]QNJ33657.1 hypothetical protein [Helianthus grosseserratus]